MLKLAPGLAAELRAAAQSASPEEICGLGFARPGSVDRVVRVVLLKNRSPAPRTTYECDPGELLDALRSAKDDGLVHRVIFHSHPQPPPEGERPRMSEVDAERAWAGSGPAWPGVLHLLIGRTTDGSLALHAFQLDAIGRWEGIQVEEG